MNVPSIRNFEINDAEAFYEMANAFYTSEAVHDTISPDFLRNTFDACINKSPFIRGFLICCGDKISGYALLTFTYSNEYGGKIMSIDELFIKGEFRKIGLADYFISTILSEYKQDISCIEIVVSKDNIAGMSLWAKHGFTPSDYLSMYKTL